MSYEISNLRVLNYALPGSGTLYRIPLPPTPQPKVIMLQLRDAAQTLKIAHTAGATAATDAALTTADIPPTFTWRTQERPFKIKHVTGLMPIYVAASAASAVLEVLILS